MPKTGRIDEADYYEIALVQYRQQFHSDLPQTLLRGYVQISTSVVPGTRCMAAVGHTFTQEAVSHCWHIMGTEIPSRSQV